MLLNCGVGENSWGSLGWQGDRISQSYRKSTWLLIGRSDSEAEVPIFWPPYAKSWPTGKDPDAGKDWGQEEKGVTKDEMVGWHHQLNGHEFEQTPRDSEGQGSLVNCHPWGHKESDTNEWLNKNWISIGKRSKPQLYLIFYLKINWKCFIALK